MLVMIRGWSGQSWSWVYPGSLKQSWSVSTCDCSFSVMLQVSFSSYNIFIFSISFLIQGVRIADLMRPVYGQSFWVIFWLMIVGVPWKVINLSFHDVFMHGQFEFISASHGPNDIPMIDCIIKRWYKSYKKVPFMHGFMPVHWHHLNIIRHCNVI